MSKKIETIAKVLHFRESAKFSKRFDYFRLLSNLFYFYFQRNLQKRLHSTYCLAFWPKTWRGLKIMLFSIILILGTPSLNVISTLLQHFLSVRSSCMNTKNIGLFYYLIKEVIMVIRICPRGPIRPVCIYINDYWPYVNNIIVSTVCLIKYN